MQKKVVANWNFWLIKGLAAFQWFRLDFRRMIKIFNVPFQAIHSQTFAHLPSLISLVFSMLLQGPCTCCSLSWPPLSTLIYITFLFNSSSSFRAQAPPLEAFPKSPCVSGSFVMHVHQTIIFLYSAEPGFWLYNQNCVYMMNVWFLLGTVSSMITGTEVLGCSLWCLQHLTQQLARNRASRNNLLNN